MSVYEEWILPPILDLVMRQKQLEDYRSRRVIGERSDAALRTGMPGNDRESYQPICEQVCRIAGLAVVDFYPIPNIILPSRFDKRARRERHCYARRDAVAATMPLPWNA
jgi:hypothetical protein